MGRITQQYVKHAECGIVNMFAYTAIIFINFRQLLCFGIS